MQQNQASALVRVLVYEGGRVDDPRDPGGRTNRGVTQRVYNAFRRRKGLANRDVYLITGGEVAEVYEGQYWDKIRGDELPGGVDLVVFDGAVNSGPVQAVKWLQRCLGVKADGIVGAVTLQGAREHPDHDRLIADICERRMIFLRALRTWAVFGRGWTSRVGNVRAAGQALASGAGGPGPVFSAAGSAKAPIEAARSAPPKGVADALAGGGVVTTALTQITDAVTPLADRLPAMAVVVTVLTAAGAFAVAGGVAYRLWAARRQDELVDALDLPVVAAPVPAATAAAEAPGMPA
ncbi:glycoside hydrolase family 108 protein [Chelatococcus reniformis]|uniref:N-acetylmuramidase n=1 Tax=Chelatococcus reniformis TaxID=1494448 RepID=A0A916TZ53_9HYPH|nr:glycoside hydrolase family 108 protein [Chelatococcus reniformis]GGC52454.1 hypothetical protein GCM10010994_09380 [Chelatococcus reniformis]